LSAMAEPSERSNPARLVLVIGGVAVWCVLICLRLGHLQILQHDEFAAEALQIQQVTRSVVAPRGILYDAHMDELAANVSVNTVHAEPRRIGAKKIADAARQLASILNLDFQELYSRMTAPSHQTHMVVKRRINPKDESLIEALGIDGIYLVEESMRVYPNRELAAQTLGFVSMNGDGGGGIEMQYDRDLKGIQGAISFDVDAKQRSFRVKVQKPAVQGHSLVLGIDKSIQYIAERELASGVTQYGAVNGIAIVMESDTGRILALANYPGVNGNALKDYRADLWRNRAICDLIEPGSTFKVVVAAAALEAGLTRPDERIDCQSGSMMVGRHVFHDHKPYDLLTFNEVLEFSSNIGAAKLGLRLGEQRLYEALRTFGFGAKTGIDLPGEIIGLVRDRQHWSGLSVPAISFGQEVGVTTMQILGAINAIANGGHLVRPFIVDRIIDENGDLIKATAVEKTRILRTETAAAVRDAFEGVILRGTGRKAALQGYRAGGKTGTAQKIVDGRYSSSKYIASFIGFAPLPKPRITVLVQINEPMKGIYGGDVSAPIFSAIAQGALMQLGVPPDQAVPMPKPQADPKILVDAEDFLADSTPVTPAEPPESKETAVPDVVTIRVASASIAVPNFTGMSKRAAAERAQKLGIRLRTSGSGTAVSQTPPAGTMISAGEACSVTFSQNKPAPAAPGVPAAGNLVAAGLPDAKRR